jgi:hypothetical protein
MARLPLLRSVRAVAREVAAHLDDVDTAAPPVVA